MSDMDIVSTGEDDAEFVGQQHQTNNGHQQTGQQQGQQQNSINKSGGSGRNGGNGGDSSAPKRMVDITRDKPIKVTIRVVVPVRDHPKFNFVGKLLGPKGNSLKRLQEDTMTKMAILGRGSMKDRHKEEELRGSGDPKFSHLLDELHVEVTAFAPPAEAHARIAYALAEVRRFLVPDYNDEIRQEQMWEMAALNSKAAAATASNPNPGSIPACPGSSAPGSNCSSASPSSSACSSAGPGTGPEDDIGAPEACLGSPQPPPAVATANGNNPQHQHNCISANSSNGQALAGVACRKRPLVVNSCSRPAMSPTKRTVLSILARARAAQAQDAGPPPPPPPHHHHAAPPPTAASAAAAAAAAAAASAAAAHHPLSPYCINSRRALVSIPGLRDDPMLAAGNILIN